MGADGLQGVGAVRGVAYGRHPRARQVLQVGALGNAAREDPRNPEGQRRARAGRQLLPVPIVRQYLQKYRHKGSHLLSLQDER